MKKAVRMADIAEELNISVVTVSKALAGKPGVGEELRAKIVALAQEMGYVNTRASSETPANRNVGVLVSERFFSGNTFYTDLYRALLMGSGNEHMTCMMEIVTFEAERNAILPSLITTQKVDGIIFMGNLDESYLQTVADTGLPCLLLDFHMNESEWNCIVSDNVNGGYTLTQHLLSTGRRDIGFVGSIRATSSIMDRYLGYQRALRTAGIIPKEEWLLEDRDEAGDFISIALPDSLPQAFVCSCDEIAYNLVYALQKQQLRIPEDVAICGYDDFRFSTLSQPQLTSYRVNVERMAELALDTLYQMLQGEQTGPLSYVVPGQIVFRDSSKTMP